MLAIAAHIFLRVLLPGLALVALGALLQRRSGLDLPTLSKLNLFVFVPAFLLVRVGESALPRATMGLVAVCLLLPMLVLGAVLGLGLRARRVPAPTAAGILVCAVLSNAGNFGVPVAELAFGSKGGEVQALVVMVMNTSIFLLAPLALTAGRNGPRRGPVAEYLRLPMVYALGAGLLVRASGALASPLPAGIDWLWKAARLAALGMVPVALVTLGAQLAVAPRWPRWRVVAPVAVVKLVAMPALTAPIVWWLGLWPWPGAGLVLAAAAPTAVNVLLLALSLDGDAELIAESVLTTTLLSAVTVTITLAWLLATGGPGLPRGA